MVSGKLLLLHMGQQQRDTLTVLLLVREAETFVLVIQYEPLPFQQRLLFPEFVEQMNLAGRSHQYFGGLTGCKGTAAHHKPVVRLQGRPFVGKGEKEQIFLRLYRIASVIF